MQRETERQMRANCAAAERHLRATWSATSQWGESFADWSKGKSLIYGPDHNLIGVGQMIDGELVMLSRFNWEAYRNPEA